MAKKVIKQMVIKTKDHKIVHDFVTARIFAVKYARLLEVNEFHAPSACKLIVESENRIYCYILSKPFIMVDAKGNVEILTTNTKAQITLNEPYYSEEELKHAKNLSKAYKYKAALGLTTKEVMDRAAADKIVDIDKVIKIEVPFRIGGGF